MAKGTSNRPKPVPSGTAFTQIELPVVIAILAARLPPALARAKDRAQSIHCLSNLKQLELCRALYIENNHDRLGPNWTGSSGSRGPESRAAVNVSRRPDATDLTVLQIGRLLVYNNTTTNYQCPMITPIRTGGSLDTQVRTASLS